MWHPNSKILLFNSIIVYPDGKVCISILHPPGTDQFNSGETADERWRPILGVEGIIVSVISMLNDPNINSPANIDAAIEYRDRRDEYIKKVKKLTRQSVDQL
jgi:ubiquitin-conjugating enzyme E2 G1